MIILPAFIFTILNKTSVSPTLIFAGSGRPLRMPMPPTTLSNRARRRHAQLHGHPFGPPILVKIPYNNEARARELRVSSDLDNLTDFAQMTVFYKNLIKMFAF
jgi:hypothetical protein